MHLGRFQYVSWLIVDYFVSNQLLANFDQVAAQLQAYIAAPTVENSKTFRGSINVLLKVCSKTPLGHNTPSFQHIISDTGGGKYFGSGLEQTLRDIFEKQSMTPAEMLVNLQKFRTQLGSYLDSITKISEEMNSLGVEYEELESDEFEFGAMFPKELVGKTIANIEEELEHLNRLFKALNEMMGNGSTSPTVRSISSSWWQFFLDLDYKQIAAITIAIERIVTLYKSNLEIQKLKRDADKIELGPEFTVLINQRIDEKLKAGMMEIAKEVRQKFQNNTDEERCNELETQLRMELVHIAKRINQGAAYEIRAGLPDKPKVLAENLKEDPQAGIEHADAMQIYEEKNKIAAEINDAGLRLSTAIEELSGETQLLTDYEKLTEIVQIKPNDIKNK